MINRWRHSRFVETFLGAFVVAAAICAAVVVVAALLIGCAVIGDLIARAV